MSPEVQNALQPTFLQDVFQRMTQQGQSFHIVGKDGKQRERLLSDVKNMVPTDWQVASISLYSYRESYLNFLDKLAQSFGITERKELTLGVIKKHIEDNKNTMFLILLDDFEKIANRIDADERYNGDFVGHLNNMREMPNMRLIIASEREGRFYWLKKDDDHKIILSWLFGGLEELKLPKYSNDEIRQEIKRHLTLPDNQMETIVDKFAYPLSNLTATIAFLSQNTVEPQHFTHCIEQHLAAIKPKNKRSLSRLMINIQNFFNTWKIFNIPVLYIVGGLLIVLIFIFANQDLRDKIWNSAIKKIFGD